MQDVKITMLCPGCDERIGFPAIEAGTIQDCPECGGWIDVPELTRSHEIADSYQDENARQYAESARQLEANAKLIDRSEKSHAEWERQLAQSAQFHEVVEASFHRFASLITRWEEMTARLERAAQRLEEKSDRDRRP